MKAIILAGGLGTRISEESHLKPKPMIEIGGKPVLWHIMKIYSHYNINEFIICAGYKGYIIKEYFANYFLHQSDVTFNLCENRMEVHNNTCEPWKVTIVDTGALTYTGGRLKRVKDYIGGETFCFTYGDGVADVNIAKLIDFHKNQGCLATMTSVQPPARYGAVEIENERVLSFREKPEAEGGWINGGFFVLEPGVIDFIEGDSTSWEIYSLAEIAAKGELATYKHAGFWLPMDTLRDKNRLEDLWSYGDAPWKVWDDE